MTPTYHQIDGLPIVGPLAIIAFAVMAWRLHRRGSLAVPRVLVAAAVCVYAAGVVVNTVFPITIGPSTPGDHWWTALNLVPLRGTEAYDMAQNVVVFVPLGILLPLVARITSWRRLVVAGFALSLLVECLQLANSILGSGGHIFDVNDLLANTLGAPLGYALFRVTLRLTPAQRLAAAATWPRSAFSPPVPSAAPPARSPASSRGGR